MNVKEILKAIRVQLLDTVKASLSEEVKIGKNSIQANSKKYAYSAETIKLLTGEIAKSEKAIIEVDKAVHHIENAIHFVTPTEPAIMETNEPKKRGRKPKNK